MMVEQCGCAMFDAHRHGRWRRTRFRIRAKFAAIECVTRAFPRRLGLDRPATERTLHRTYLPVPRDKRKNGWKVPENAREVPIVPIDLVAFSSENRWPLFRKMLSSPPAARPTVRPARFRLERRSSRSKAAAPEDSLAPR